MIQNIWLLKLFLVLEGKNFTKRSGQKQRDSRHIRPVCGKRATIKVYDKGESDQFLEKMRKTPLSNQIHS